MGNNYIHKAVILKKLIAGLAVLVGITISTPAGSAGEGGTEVTEAELSAFSVQKYTEGESFPLENLVTPDGLPFDPRSIAGKYVLLNLWATWCPYCVEEKPSLQRFYEQYHSETFTVLTVSLGEDPLTVGEYLESNQYTLPAVVDTENRLRAVYAPRIPRTYILDPQGNITASISGNKAWLSGEADRILRYLIPVVR
jgi:thiol-disulfide isomerase/thioredoxin